MHRLFSARAYSRILKIVEKEGTFQPSSRGNTKEILNMNLELKNVRDRLVTESWRKLNFPFAIAEWLGTMLGISELSFFTTFVHNYVDYSTDGKHVDGSYGERVIEPVPDNAFTSEIFNVNQFKAAIDMLKKNPDSRRAVVAIYNWMDLYGYGGKNTPCTLNLQFLIRNDKLLMFTNMRSNDAVKGLTNDLIVFTMAQEFVANQLGLKCGSYFHNAASFHLYEEDWKYAHLPQTIRFSSIMQPMPTFDWMDLTHLAKVYWVASSDHKEFMSAMEMLRGNEYLLNLGAAARAWVLRKDDVEMSSKWYKACSDYAIRRVLRPWMSF